MKNVINKKNAVKITGFFAFMFLMLNSGQMNAQKIFAGQIEEVKVYKTLTNKILEKKIMEMLDLSNTDLEEGKTYQSDVRFTVTGEGKVSRVSAQGENRTMNKALEAVVSGLDLSKYPQVTADSYVLPVTVDVE